METVWWEHLIVMKPAICFGNNKLNVRFLSIKYKFELFSSYFYRGKACQSYYDEILENKGSEHSNISFRTIEILTQLLTNFAKFG